MPNRTQTTSIIQSDVVSCDAIQEESLKEQRPCRLLDAVTEMAKTKASEAKSSLTNQNNFDKVTQDATSNPIACPPASSAVKVAQQCLDPPTQDQEKEKEPLLKGDLPSSSNGFITSSSLPLIYEAKSVSDRKTFFQEFEKIFDDNTSPLLLDSTQDFFDP